ncbi:MAG TPA: RidA family protein [Caulobacteraceae bacterium]|nr:RidA family protein [Caulobacteraceae bacterium]
MKTLIAAAALLSAGASAQAAELKRMGTPEAIIAQAVVVPAGATTVYVSGITPPATNAGAPAGTPPAYGDTKTQTIGILTRISDILKAQGMTMGDLVMLRVALVADPATGKMDFAGMNAGYSQFFGTAAQPNKPARITVQVAKLVADAFLVEIEGQAAKVP